MSVEAQKWAWGVAGVHYRLKLLLLAIADSADDVGRGIPTLQGLCSKTAMSRVTVMRCLVDLERRELIERRQNYGANDLSSSTEYRLAMGGNSDDGAG